MNVKPASLRWRVTLAFGVLGCLLSLLFASATTFITEHFEAIMAEGMIDGLSQELRERHAANPDRELALPHSRLLQGYLQHADGRSNVPAELSALPPGIQEFELESDKDAEVHVGVFDLDGDRLFLVIDMHEVEQLELYLERVLAGIVVAGTAISAWLGWLLAGRTIAPVRQLAEAVEALPPHAKRTRLAADMASDELGRLATAIDGYQERLIQTEERERKFFADASHELRTPLSVVRGATELLLDDGKIDNTSRERLRRLDRGVLTLTDLLEVMLRQARGLTSPMQTVDTETWLRETLADLDSGGDVNFEIGQATLCVKPREAGLVVRGLIRRLGRSEQTRELDVSVRANTITLRHALDSTRTSSGNHDDLANDTRLGATLTGRLAAEMNWSINEDQVESGRITIMLPASGA